MKKRILSAVLAAGTLAASGLAPRAWAQPGPGDGGAQAAPSGGGPGEEAPPGGGEQGGGKRDRGEGPERLKARLGLSDEQAAKLKTAMDAHRDGSKAAMDQMRKGMDKLRDQVRGKASDDDVKATLETLKAARKSMREQEEKFEESLASFLTPTQRAKMLMGMLMHERQRGGPRGRGGDRGGRGDGGGRRDGGGGGPGGDGGGPGGGNDE